LVATRAMLRVTLAPFRAYDPGIGRFLAEDPIRLDGGVNFFTYVDGNPINLIDPFGLEEGSPANLARRALIDRIARSYNGSHAWDFNVRKDNFPAGSWKCNKFVCDVTSEAGAPVIFTPRGGGGRCPLAREIASPTVRIPNWRVLALGEAPQPGDVAAFPLQGGGAAYSGHSGIITSQDNISMHGDGIYTRRGEFSPTRRGITFRRYTGE
jgi:uncharacterized protein RhaS with RHS repeats